MDSSGIRVTVKSADWTDLDFVAMMLRCNRPIPVEYLPDILRNAGDRPIPESVRNYIADALDPNIRKKPGPQHDEVRELHRTWRAMKHYDLLLPYVRECQKEGWVDCEIDVPEELRDETPGIIAGTLVQRKFWPHASTRHVLNRISEFRNSDKYYP